MTDFARAPRRRPTCALGVRAGAGAAALAWSLGAATAAHAQCAPDPTTANGTTTCTGTDANGIRVTTGGTTLTVASGATVTDTGAPAIAVDVPRSSTVSSTSDVINVQGAVSAGGQNAITVSSGAPYAGGSYSAQSATFTIGAGGSVSGSTAIALLQSAGNASGTVAATIDNSGSLTGTSGIALSGAVTATSSYGYVSALTSFSITNRAGASIVGGILGPVSTLTNAGAIDGGSGAAINTGGLAGYTTLTNAATGTIRSNFAAATILTASAASLSLTNAGAIANAGAGAAISAGTLNLTNQAGGRIGSAGSAAITAGTSLTLTNAGAVTGNVSTGNGASTVDSTAGTITGSVTFGAGNDTLIARYVGAPTLATGVTGGVNGGGGTNTERVVFAADTNVTTPINLDANFQQLVLAPAAKVTATLQPGFAAPGALVLSGQGAVVNRATLALPSQGVTDTDYAFGSAAAFRNDGAITVTNSGYGQYGLTLSDHSFTNTGSVSVVGGGGGVSMSYNPVVNSGAITAAGTGVSLFDGVLTNGASGSITSTAGAGVDLYGNVGYTSSNAGIIRGATTGAITDIYLTNTGTIGSAGVGVSVQPYGYLINAAGGVVNGGSGGAVTAYAFNAGVANAGTINGNVTYTSADNSVNYIALPGGVLNGNLSLSGGTLVTSLTNTGTGQFAGITGTVTATSGAALRYTVDADATTTLPAAGTGPFSSIGYQLSNNANLTVTATAGQTRAQTLTLAGVGGVDLTAAIATTGAPAIQSTSAITYPGVTAAATGLTITSRGTLAVTRASTNGYNYANGVVALSSADNFTNVGSITVADRTTYGMAAIYGGASATNNGQITLDGGVGVSGAATVVNAGAITQVNGGASSRGVAGFTTLTNTGTISVSGIAAQLTTNYSGTNAGGTIINSGAITSTGGPAIASDSSFYGPVTITNQAGGVIAGVGRAIQLGGATLTNAGAITGTVDLGYGGATYRSYTASTYVAAGGTIAGDLLFGGGADLLLQTGDSIGVSGTVDGGAGTNIYGRSLSATGSAAIDPAGLKNFQDALIQAVGAGTVATATATGTFGGNLYAVGDGSIVNQAALSGTLYVGAPYAFQAMFPAAHNTPASVTNAAAIGGVSGTTAAFTNNGSVTLLPNAGTSAVQLSNAAPLSFTNTGAVTSNGGAYTYGYGASVFYGYYVTPTVNLTAQDGLTVANSGAIGTSGLLATVSLTGAGGPAAVGLTNSGTIRTVSGYTGADVEVKGSATDVGGAAMIANSGTISAQGAAAGTSSGAAYPATSATGLNLSMTGIAGAFTYTLANTGTISATGTSATAPVIGVLVEGGPGVSGAIANAAGGSITATGPRAYGVVAADHALTLTNAGTITATGASASVAVQTFDAYANTVRNTGTITGDVRLAAGADVVDNAGTITGNVSLGDGNDTFIQRAGGTVSGLVDGGAGANAYVVDATGGVATLAAGGIANFATVTQTGTGTGTYSGAFGVGTITLAGGTLAVAGGQTLSTAGAASITGAAGAGPLTVTNAGTIAGGITLADGNDTVVNNGVIRGAVRLGSGDDTYVEGVGSSVGGVDGGGGTNLYRVVLAGARTGIGARTNFQNLAVDGTGALALTLDQDFGTVTLNGTGLTLTSAGHSVGGIVGTGTTGVQVALDRDVGSVRLGGGNDVLSLAATTLAGAYDGGAGTNALRLTAAGPVTLSGSATDFQTIALAGGALTITGTLGGAGAPLAFAGGESVTVARGGTLAGVVDLGSGANSFRLAAGGTLAGSVAGGGGVATLDLSAGDTTLRAGALTAFSRLATEGAGTLTLAGGAFAYPAVAVAGNLTIAADAGLTAALAFGPADNHLIVAGGFTGSVDGGAGMNGIDVSGGTAAAPVAFSSIANVAAYRQSAGFATVSGTATLGGIAMTGGRLVGLAGSTIAAPMIAVGQGATFGSAGTVVGNVQVAGTLSPGASPGTMTVNGNVALAATATALFEITPAVSDKLVVNGAVTIASGATLQLAPSQAIAPGSSLTLVTASGGITGAFTTVVKPASLFGFVVEDATTIRLLGQFQTDPGFSPQVARAVGYVNNVLTGGQSTAALLAAVPALATNGVTNAAAFAQLTPEPYAAARQVSVDNGLALADAARGSAFAPARAEPGAFTFAATLGGVRTLGPDADRGTAQATNDAYGFLGGVGYAGLGWSVGAFGGWLHDRQSLSGLGARTTAQGAVAGVHARLDRGGLGVRATIAYDGAAADTRRTVPGGSAQGRYDLHGWTADAELSYALPMAGGWSVRPSVGATAIRATRDGVAEAGGSPYALTVARDRATAAFIDGAATFAHDGRVRPYLTIGARYQAQGRTPDALAGLGGGGLGLLAAGATRAPVLATATLGADAAVDQRLSLFVAATGESGDADHRAAGRAGLRLAF